MKKDKLINGACTSQMYYVRYLGFDCCQSYACNDLRDWLQFYCTLKQISTAKNPVETKKIVPLLNNKLLCQLCDSMQNECKSYKFDAFY